MAYEDCIQSRFATKHRATIFYNTLIIAIVNLKKIEYTPFIVINVNVTTKGTTRRQMFEVKTYKIYIRPHLN